MAGGPVGKNPLFPRTAWWRIGPRRQGFASPLRALDCSGPILEDSLIQGKGDLCFGVQINNLSRCA